MQNLVVNKWLVNVICTSLIPSSSLDGTSSIQVWCRTHSSRATINNKTLFLKKLVFMIASSKKIICRAFSHTEKSEKGAGYKNTIQARRCARSFLVPQIKEADLCTQVPRHVSAMGIGEKKIDGKLEQGWAKMAEANDTHLDSELDRSWRIDGRPPLV